MNGTAGVLQRSVVLLVAAALLALGTVSFVRRVGAELPSLGVEWVRSSMGPVAVRVDAGSTAATAGVQLGDRLLRIEGRPVTSSLEASEAPWRVDRHGSLEIVVRRGASELELQLHPVWSPRSEPYVYLVIVGLACWASGLLIALRWPGIRGGQLYTLLAACLYGQLVLSHTGKGDPFDWLVYWIDTLSGALWPALLLHLAVALTRRRLRRHAALLAGVYVASATLAAWALWLAPRAHAGELGFADPVAAMEMRDRIEALATGLAMMWVVWLLSKAYSRSASVMRRSQLRWLLFGLVVGLGPYVMLYAVPWAVGAPELPQWAQFLSVAPLLLVPATFATALARYRLHDLDRLLLRGLSEVTSVFFTFAVLAATVFLLRDGLGELLPMSRGATRYLGFLVAAVAYPQVRSWVRSGIDRAFYRQRYSYRSTLLDWARELNAETDLHSLLTRLRSRIRDTLGVPEAAVLVRTGHWRFESVAAEDDRPLDLDEATLRELEEKSSVAAGGVLASVPWARYLFSMRVKGQLRAVMAIAEREPPEEPLTTEDRALLGTLAAQAGTAIEAARLVLEVRQRAEEIERLHARQERILESSAVGLLLLDGHGRIQAWNRALESMYGLDRVQAIGRRLTDVLPLQVARRIERESARAVGNAPQLFRLQMITRDDRRVLVNVAISAVGEDEQGPDGGFVVTLDDVTERARLEEQLAQQERLASLGLLAAGVAHEINTPLTGISSYAQLLLEDEAIEERRALLAKIEAQTERASGIANSLLNLARPDRATFGSLDLNETIREALQLFAPQVRRRGIRVVTQLSAHVPRVLGHRGKLQQVLLNLLINARDAVGSEGRIVITTRMTDSRVEFEIADDGAGISGEDLPRVFDPFFTTKTRGKGTGLGLSVSYGIVQEHDGEILAECRGGMTRFRVVLPPDRAEAAG